jgi:putative DNA primase/helicase
MKTPNTTVLHKRIISLFNSTKDNLPAPHPIDWSELGELLSVHDEREEKDGSAFSGAEFTPNKPRKKENAVKVNFVVLDIDHGNKDTFIARCKQLGWACIIYSTYSHTAGNACFRAVFQPSRSILPAEWPTVWDAMNYLLGANADKATRDISHIFFTPSHPKASKADAFVAVIEGDKPVDVEALLITPVIKTVIMKARTKKSSSKSSDDMSCREIADEMRERFAGGLWYYHENFRMYTKGYWKKLDQRVEVTKAILEQYADLSSAGAYETTETLKILCSELANEHDIEGDKAHQETMRRLICLKNGTLDPVTRELLPHAPEHRRMCALDIAWDPAAKAKRFLEFLREIWGDEPDYAERVEFLQEWLGYLLLPSNRFERFLWLTGSGANGKSVLLEVMANLVGRENTTWAHLDRLNRTAVRATLEGKMLNISTEMNADGTLADGHLKSITSGEPVDAEPKYKDPYSFIPTVKLVAATNHLPRLKDTSGGFARRACILTFNKVFTSEQRDVNLGQALTNELAGILAWSLEGLARLLERGRLVPPPSSDATVQDYRTEADSVSLFNHECLDPCETGTPVGTLYAIYREYCTTNGFQPTNAPIFGRRLSDAGVLVLRKSCGKPIRAAKMRKAAEAVDAPVIHIATGNVVAISRKGTKVNADELFGDLDATAIQG